MVSRSCNSRFLSVGVISMATDRCCRSGAAQILGLGLALIAGGQTLNLSVFYRLGKVGVFYGDRFGHQVPWCQGVPFSLFKHPQYAGTLPIWGFFLVVRFPHDDWYLFLFSKRFITH